MARDDRVRIVTLGLQERIALSIVIEKEGLVVHVFRSVLPLSSWAIATDPARCIQGSLQAQVMHRGLQAASRLGAIQLNGLNAIATREDRFAAVQEI